MDDEPKIRIPKGAPDVGPFPEYVSKYAYHQCDSPLEWIRSWESKGRDLRRFRTQHNICGTNVLVPDWVLGGEIRVFRMSTIPASAVAPVIEGIEYMLGVAGASLHINNYRNHYSMEEQIATSLDENGKLRTRTIKDLVVTEPWRNPSFGGKPHADVYLTDKYFSGENADWLWDITRHDAGLMLLALPGTRSSNHEMLRNVASHSTGHLLGMQFHHDEAKTPGYVLGSCAMLESCSQYEPCDQCSDAVRAVWRGVLAELEAHTAPVRFVQR